MYVVLVAAMLATSAQAFEDCKMLPAGVRNIDVRNVSTDFDQTTNNAGNRVPLANPLNQNLTFDMMAKQQDPLKASQLRAFMASNGFNPSDPVGQYTADLKGHLNVLAPVISYGITDNFNIGFAVPVYDASTSISVGFQPTATAQAFLTKLADPKNNQSASARDAAAQLNQAVAKLNKKLADNHYRALTDWHRQGIGDTTIGGKYRALNREHLVIASTTGVIAPTGRTADPNNLTDIPFGFGVWAPFEELALDQPLVHHLTLNEYGKYTTQLPGHKNLRAQNDAEKIEVGDTSTDFKLGDYVDAGTSLRWEPDFGLMTGVGYIFHHKYGDLYRGGIDPQTKSLLQGNSEQKYNLAELMIGYSTVPLYYRHEVAIPLDARFTYQRMITGQNYPLTNLAQFDFNLYF